MLGCFGLQLREALAYGAYMVCTTFLPQAVNVVTLFYGGSLVLDGRMSAGALVAFMLYVASLNGAFQARARCSLPLSSTAQFLHGVMWPDTCMDTCMQWRECPSPQRGSSSNDEAWMHVNLL
jgi:ABC-type multidrug transport system fused ATPase/permease subunit